MAVRIRMKRFGRRHRPFFRVCAVDGRAMRDGRVIEELGIYDPMIKEVDARAILKGDRIDYWLGVGAQPSDKVRVLIQKYGAGGTHLEQQTQALERLKTSKPRAPAPMKVQPLRREELEPAAPAAAEVAAEAAAEPAVLAAAEASSDTNSSQQPEEAQEG